MKIVDCGNKLVMRDTVDGQEKSIAFIEYREHTATNRVVTGVIAALPHLDAFVTGTQLLDYLRAKYPRGTWALETEPAWCSRPEYLAMIQRGVEEGFDYYDVIGEYTEEQVELTENWEWGEIATRAAPHGDLPSQDLWEVMSALDAEIDAE